MRLADRLRAALARPPSRTLALLPGDAPADDPPQTPSAAAVLIAITDRPRPGVILTQRNANLRRHAGQIAFPGGRIDPDDRDAIEAALREAEEEIALPRHAVEVIGAADPYRTISGFNVTPVIGVAPPDLALAPAEAEVADMFEAPLDFLLDAANHAERRIHYQGRERGYYEIQWQDRRIWGATAAMIVNLSRRLRWPA